MNSCQRFVGSRRNTAEDATVPKYMAWICTESPQLFYCACDGGSSRSKSKAIDPFDYDLVATSYQYLEDKTR